MEVTIEYSPLSNKDSFQTTIMGFYSLRQGTLEFMIDMIFGISYRTCGMQNEDNYAITPGNVDYPFDFVDAWHTIVTKEELDDLCTTHDFWKDHLQE